MGMSESALYAPLARPAVTGMVSLRRALAIGLGRVAYGLFYAAVLALLVGVPLGAGYLVWYWLMH